VILIFECEFVVMVVVIRGQSHVAGHAHETDVNVRLEITVGDRGHEIDDVGPGHMIAANVGRDLVHETVGDGKMHVILTTKNHVCKSFPLIQLLAMYLSLLTTHVLSVVSDPIT